jgi:serine/threonine protein phosphatase PrpC
LKSNGIEIGLKGSNGMASEKATLSITSGSMTHKGKVRQQNEDSILVSEFTLKYNEGKNFLGYYGVADGMGGYENGEVASRLALETFANQLMGLPGRLNTILPSIAAVQELKEGVCKANSKIYSTAMDNGNSMGTTLAAVLVINDTAYIAGIGDSRVYLLRGNGLKQITTDHSYVAELVAEGQISPEDIYTHPHRNIVTRYLGMDKSVVPGIFMEKLKPSDTILLCSDGLWEMVSDADIESVLKKTPDPQTACSRLVDAANINGGTDNISVIAVLTKMAD